jgi:acetyltransferase
MGSSTNLLVSETILLGDGASITIRPIRPDDADDLQAAFQHLSMESIYLRFLSVKKELTDEEARQLSSVDYEKRMAFVATYLEDGQEIVVGVARYALLNEDSLEKAESAVIVTDAFQHRGIGRRLLQRLVEYARQKGIRTLSGNLQVGNMRMLDLVKRSGLPYRQRFAEGIWEVTIDISQPERRTT